MQFKINYTKDILHRLPVRMTHKFVILILFAFFINDEGRSQHSKPDSSRQELLSIAREIISDARYCGLISIDKEGQAHVRTMDPFPPEEDFTIWFGTNPNSQKVSQIQNNPKVTLYFQSNDNSGYISIYGQAEIINQLDLKTKMFKQEWKNFYPAYPEEYRLIKFSPEKLEVISIPHGINGDIITWKAPEVNFNNK